MEVAHPRGKRKQDGVPGRLLQPCYIVQKTTLLLPPDSQKVRRWLSDLWGDPEKVPAQKQWPDARRQGERPGGTTCTC